MLSYPLFPRPYNYFETIVLGVNAGMLRVFDCLIAIPRQEEDDICSHSHWHNLKYDHPPRLKDNMKS